MSAAHEPLATIVTGASGGIGRAIANEAGQWGSVVGVDIAPRPMDWDDDDLYLQLDVSDPASADAAVAATLTERGQIGGLVNAAGVGWLDRDGSVLDIDLETWNSVLAINLTGAMLFSRAVVRALLDAESDGSLVHIASLAGLRVMDSPLDAYQVSKAGLISLS